MGRRPVRDISKEIQDYKLLLYSSNYREKNPVKINIRNIIRVIHKEMQHIRKIRIPCGTTLQAV
jgi:hypothetical protein